MFKKFNKAEDVASNTAIKSSHQRGIRSKLLEQMPLLSQPGGPPTSDDPDAEPPTLLEVLWPKKEAPALIKCREHISLLALHGQPLFFQHFDAPYMPTLRLLQQYPDLLPKVQIDKGGIKFILAGANVMCPGLTSKGGYLTPGLQVGQPVAIFAEGKETPCAIGIMKMTTDEIKSVNKGHGIENATYLGDDLWTNAKDF